MAGVIALYVVETIFTVLALLAVALRLWARRLTKRELALNDWAAIAALVGSSTTVVRRNRSITDALKIFNFGFAATAYIGKLLWRDGGKVPLLLSQRCQADIDVLHRIQCWHWRAHECSYRSQNAIGRCNQGTFH